MGLDRVLHFNAPPRTELQAIEDRFGHLKEWPPEVWAQWHAALHIGSIKPVHERIREHQARQAHEAEYGAIDDDGPMYSDWDTGPDQAEYDEARELINRISSF